MKRTFKYKSHISKWYDVDIGDVLILEGEDGTIFDTVIMMESNTKSKLGKCVDCPLSENNVPGECMHYAFACSNKLVASSIDTILENL